MKEYDVFIPLYYNDGTPIEAAKFQDVQARLLEQFEGLTYFPYCDSNVSVEHTGHTGATDVTRLQVRVEEVTSSAQRRNK